MINTQNLGKTFARGKSKVEAVRQINLQVQKGDIFGFLGPNGAGKTTTLRMLTTLMTPTSGSATIMGFDLVREAHKIRQEIGYVSQRGGCYGFASGLENLVLQGRLYGQSKAEAHENARKIIKVLKLEEYYKRHVMTYSGGQRRHIELGMGVMHNPRLLFLDEPTTGLDPASRANFWQEILSLRDQGMTIFLTTHYMDEAEALCNKLCIMDYGQIVAEGTALELKRQISGDSIEIGMDPGNLQTARDLLLGQADIQEITIIRNTLKLCVEAGEKALPKVLPLLVEANLPLTSIEMKRPSLDEVFLKITGRALNSATGESVE